MYDDPVCRELGGCKWADVPVAAIQCCMMYTPDDTKVVKRIDEAVREIKREVQQLKFNMPEQDKPKKVSRVEHEDVEPRRRSKRRRK